ncbi:MAG TPA: PLD nuclease N-terminal domain-containing protein [Armatimonadota bacterium]|jgi:hypothetical protein|nr:PLD nuclease N-terminal domain-containing protein [Armatimonadota bacterium]
MHTGSGGPEIILIGLFGCVGIIGFFIWIGALIDCVKREFDGENEKLIWVLIIVLAGWIGALVYLFIGKEKGRLTG